MEFESPRVAADLGPEQAGHGQRRRGQFVLLVVDTQFDEPVLDVACGFVVELVDGLDAAGGLVVLGGGPEIVVFLAGVGIADAAVETFSLGDEPGECGTDRAAVAVDPYLLRVAGAAGPSGVSGELFVRAVVDEECVEAIEAVTEALARPDAEGSPEFSGRESELEPLAQESAFAATLLPPAPGVEHDRVVVVGGRHRGRYSGGAAVEDPADHVAGIGSQL
ncbi:MULTISPECIES: hypothetical protein [unclassified Pseudonocardia]|uniref:hypothetical protein n=1 Tax=unclassified Pseudonocardia TaxID=2619320 RepID=UPI0001FFDB16|nr:hypothetical protein [Pseudonocardia sp. Ae707_Ps1]